MCLKILQNGDVMDITIFRSTAIMKSAVTIQMPFFTARPKMKKIPFAVWNKQFVHARMSF